MDKAFLLLIILLIVGLLLIYNKLVRLSNKVRASWSDVDVQLKRRHDLIPNLVETVQGYASHERKTFEEVIALRSESEHTEGVSARAAVERTIGADIKRLLAVVEAYPELKADERFQDLHHALIEVEDTLQYARRYYNGSVRDYNTLRESFPVMLFGEVLGFHAAEYFEVDDAAERRAPNVNNRQ